MIAVDLATGKRLGEISEPSQRIDMVLLEEPQLQQREPFAKHCPPPTKSYQLAYCVDDAAYYRAD